MSTSFRFHDGEPVPDAISRITGELVAEARTQLDRPDAEAVADAVHTARKRLKELRAVARLVRPEVGSGYGAANAVFRDAGRLVAGTRDSQALVDICVDLAGSTPGAMAVDLGPVRAELARQRDAAVQRLVDDPGALERARALVDEGWGIVRRWELADDFSTLAGGLAKTYTRAVAGFRRARDEPTTEHLHEWRKRVKYHRYHLELLEGIEPPLMVAWADRLHDLSDLLGDDHDLAVLRATVLDAPDRYGGAAVVDALRILTEGRRADLQSRAVALGARVTAEDADAVVDRIGRWWEAWRTHGPSPTRTELDDFGPD